MSKKKKKHQVTDEETQKAAKIASLLGLLSIMPSSKIGDVVQVSPSTTARRVPNGIYYQHIVTNQEGQLVHVHSETRTDLHEQKGDILDCLEELGHEFED